MTRLIVFAVAGVFAVSGCGKKPVEVTLKVSEQEENLVVEVTTQPGVDEGELELTGQGFFLRAPQRERLDVLGAGKFVVRGSEVKPGKYKVTATMVGGYQGTATIDYERKGKYPDIELAAAKETGVKIKLKTFVGSLGIRSLYGDPDGTVTAKVVKGKGCRWSMGGKETVLAEGTLLTIDLKPFVGGMKWGFWQGSFPPEIKVPVRVVATDGGEWPIDLRFSAQGGIVHLVLAAVQKGPLAFEGDPAAPPKPRSAVYLDQDDSDKEPRLIGQAALIRDVDLVVFEKCKWEDLSPCGTYSSSRIVKTIRRSRCEATVTAYDRRKGTVAGTKVFPSAADPVCPKSITASRNWVVSTPDFNTVRPWVESLLK